MGSEIGDINHFRGPVDTATFLKAVTELRDELNIRPGEGTSRDRARIAKAVEEAWLTANGRFTPSRG